MADGLQFSQAVAGQQGNTPAQQAAIDQSSTLPAASASAPTSGTPNFNSVSSTNLQPTTPVTIPPPVQSPDQSGGLVAGAQQTSNNVQDYINKLTPTQPTALDQQQSGLLGQIAALTGQDTGKSQALIDAQNASGATQAQSDLNSLNNQLKIQTAQYNQQAANVGSGVGGLQASAAYNAQTAGLQRAQAANVALLSAQIQAKQGDLTLAMNTAQQAVDAKYSTIEDNIKTSQAQLAAIQPMLTEEQKTTALAQQQVLTDQANAIAAQKATETQINNVALEAAKAGASSDVVASINNAKDVVSAIAAAAPALGQATAMALQKQQFDENVQLQQLAISKAQEGIAAENAATSRMSANLNQQKILNEMSPAALMQYAQTYQATGVMPPQAVSDGLAGAVNAIATGAGTKNGQPALPLAPGTIYNTVTKVADSKLTPEQENNVSQLYNVVNNVLPQLSQNFGQNTNLIENPNAQQAIQDYNSTADSLKAALATMNTAGILKGGTSNLEGLIPSSTWLLNTSAGKRDIANLTTQITQQLQSYLSTNGLSIAGFNDTTEQTGVNSPNSLSQFAK